MHPFVLGKALGAVVTLLARPQPPPDQATAQLLVRHSLGVAHLPARPPALPRLRTRTPPRAPPRHCTRRPVPEPNPWGHAHLLDEERC